MSLPIFQIDAFADRPFTGNPAAVVFPADEPDSHWMQSVAAEMNLSETAFARKLAANRFDLRWFTPLTEVDLCGHATLATGHWPLHMRYGNPASCRTEQTFVLNLAVAS